MSIIGLVVGDAYKHVYDRMTQVAIVGSQKHFEGESGCSLDLRKMESVNVSHAIGNSGLIRRSIAHPDGALGCNFSIIWG